MVEIELEMSACSLFNVRGMCTALCALFDNPPLFLVLDLWNYMAAILSNACMLVDWCFDLHVFVDT